MKQGQLIVIMSLLGLGVFVLVLLTFRLAAGYFISTKNVGANVTLGEDSPSLQSPPPSIEIISTPSVPVEIKSGIPGDTTPNSNPVLSTSAVISTSCLGQILITEVMVHPNGVEPDDEWLELYNAGDCVVDLSSYKVGDEETSGQGEGMLGFPAGAKFNPGQVLVIANQAIAFSTSYGFLPDYEMKDSHPEVKNLERYTKWSSGSFNLANSGDEVILLNATDQVVDAVSWGSSSFAFNPSLKSPCPNCSFGRIGYDFNVPATAALWVEQHTPNPGRVDFNSNRGTTTQAPVKTVTLTPVTPSPTRTVRSLSRSTPTHAPTPFTGRLFISEVLYDSVGPEPEEEWFEIYNPEGSAIDLSSFKIGDEETSGGNEGMYKFPDGARIVSGGVIVIAVHANSFQARYGLEPDFEVVDSDPAIPNLEKYTRWASSTIYLSNTGDEVLLLDGTDSLVDVVSWGSSIFAFGPSVKLAGSGHSLERFPANMDTNTAGDWREQASPGPGSVDLSTTVSTPSMTNPISPSTQPSPVRSMTPSPTRTATSTPTNTPTPSNTPTHTATWTTTITPSPSLNPNGRLVISEVLYWPAAIGIEEVFEPADEWIEIYNLESYPVDLSVYKIGDAAIEDPGEGMLMFPPGASIAPGQVVVVANQGDRFYDRYGFKPDYEMLSTDPLVQDMLQYIIWSWGSVSLGNSGDEVFLLDAGNDVVDVVSWGNSGYAFNPPLPEVAEGHSIERCPVNVDTGTAADWRDQPNPTPGNVIVDNLICGSLSRKEKMMFIPRRAGMRRPPIGRAEMALQTAHRLLSTGHPEEAARIFNTLADGMDMRGMKIRAAMIRMQTAYAEALSNMSLQAVRSAGMALDILATANRPMKTALSTGRVINVLRQKGYEKEATELEAKVDALLEKAGSSRQQVMQQLAAARGQHHRELPAKCPSCGGSLLPDEVEWHDASTASCTYCGSAVKAS